jgi:hypothetical protein
MNKLSQKELSVLAKLQKDGHNFFNPFDITEDHLTLFVRAYSDVFANGSMKLSSSNFRYARKLAGLSLMKLNIMLGHKVNDIKSGMIYLLENPIFPDHYKVGITVDIDARLSQYQTSDPYRNFKFKHYEFVLNRREMEKRMLNDFSISIENGEWIRKNNAVDVFRTLTAYENSEKNFHPIPLTR